MVRVPLKKAERLCTVVLEVDSWFVAPSRPVGGLPRSCIMGPSRFATSFIRLGSHHVNTDVVCPIGYDPAAVKGNRQGELCPGL
jgi:hypothetical protein